MKFEDVLTEVGDLGTYQKMMIALLFIPRMVLPCHFLINNFMGAIPDHRCDISGLDDGKVFENLTQDQRLTISIPAEGDGTLSSCRMFTEPQFHLLHNSSGASEIPAAPCQYGWVYDNSTFSSTIATEWDLTCDRKGMNGATATIFFIGVMFGAALFGALSDRFGRKSMLLLSYLLSISFGLVSAFSKSYLMFAIMRFFTGLGLTGISIISYVLILEWVGIENRAFVGVLGSVSWSLGNMMLGGFAYLVNEWRLLIIVVTSPLGLAVITWWWIPESARWLVANGRVKTAHSYLTKCAECNHKMEPMSKITVQTLSSVVTVHHKGKKYTFLDMVKTPNMRRRVALTGILWFGIASTYYGLSLDITGFGLNVYWTHFIYGAIEIPAKVLVYISMNKFGRRTTQSSSLILAGVCIAINIIAPRDMWYFRTFFAVMGKGLSEAAFTTVFLYTSELYPTVLRQNGLGYCSLTARVGVAITPLVMLLQDVWRFLPQTIICIEAISFGLLATLLPETLNELLPETIEDVELMRKKPGSPPAQEMTEPALKPLSSDLIEKGFAPI